MPLLLTEDRGAVRHLVLNRPEKRNALSGDLIRELGAAIEESAADEEVRVVVLPDLGGCSRLSAVVGLGNAKELIMTGRVIDGREAHRIGFANRIAPAERARPGHRGARERAAGMRASSGRTGQAGTRRRRQAGGGSDARTGGGRLGD